MINATNAVPKMDHVRTGYAGLATEDSNKVRCYIRDAGDGQAQLTDDARGKGLLKRGGQR